MSILVDVNGISKKFGAFWAVRDLSFQVRRGEVLGFLGPNGAGKTTAMRMISGYYMPDAGSVHVCGANVRERPMQARQSIGYLPEGAPLYPDMTPRMMFRFSCESRGDSKQDIVRKIGRVCDIMHLEDVMDQAIETLSKGFKRRTGFAFAMLHDPDVLILDEPTDGLDPNQKHEVRLRIKDMAQDKAIIISTHILEEVEAICTRNVIIAQGQKLADGTTKDILALGSRKKMSFEEVFRELTVREPQIREAAA